MPTKQTLVCPDLPVTPESPAPATFHTMVYDEYGTPHANCVPVICVHGLTRNGRDFERLATALAGSGHYVVCPSLVGRGDSDPLASAAYTYEQYLADMRLFLAHIAMKVERRSPFAASMPHSAEAFADSPTLLVDWVGTSMGGVLAMMLGAESPALLRRLILNDVGAIIPKEALNRIGAYVAMPHFFPDYPTARAYVLETYATPFGLTRHDDIDYLTDLSIRALPAGGYGVAYDERIGLSFAFQLQLGGFTSDIDLWEFWRKIMCPVLILRGAQSSLLPRGLAEAMQSDPPSAQENRIILREYAGCAHAPSLMELHQIGDIVSYLGKGLIPL